MFPRQEVCALGAPPVVHGKETGNLDTVVKRFDVELRPKLKRDDPLEIDTGKRCCPTRRVRVERDKVDPLHPASGSDLAQKNFVIMLLLIDRRARRASERTAMPTKRMNARVGPLSGLHENLVLEDVVETISISAGHEDNAIALIKTMPVHVLEDIGPPKVPNEVNISLR